jgi:hypothetical protein
LQIAAILHDNGIGTYIPTVASCESSCANIFLGGANRLVVGQLGVHQFYSAGEGSDGAVRKDVATAATQYTTSDIIGIMNQLDTPPFVYEKMFGTTDIYYFKPSELPQLNRGLEDVAFLKRVEDVDAFLVRTPSALIRPQEGSSGEAVAAAAPVAEPALPPVLPTMNEVAAQMMYNFNADWSLPNEQALAKVASYYASSVYFYGSYLSYSDVLKEKVTFAERWPVRNYRVDPSSVTVRCADDGCLVDAVIEWSAASPTRGKKASGKSTWSLVLMEYDGRLLISSESGATLQRD